MSTHPVIQGPEESNALLFDIGDEEGEEGGKRGVGEGLNGEGEKDRERERHRKGDGGRLKSEIELRNGGGSGGGALGWGKRKATLRPVDIGDDAGLEYELQDRYTEGDNLVVHDRSTKTYPRLDHSDDEDEHNGPQLSPTIPLLSNGTAGFHSFELEAGIGGRSRGEDRGLRIGGVGGRAREDGDGGEDGGGELHYELLGAGATSSLSAAIANMSNSILGAGIIGLPFAIAEAGFFTGITLLIVLCFVTDWTIRLVILDGKLCGKDSYIGIMEHCFGYWGRVSVSLFQFAFALGGMCACGVIIGDTIPHVIAALFPWLADIPVLSLLLNRKFVVAASTLFVSYPLSLYRDISKLSHASSMALVSMFVIVASVLIRGPGVAPELRGSQENVYSILNGRVFEAIGVISFAYVCHHNINILYRSLHVPTLDRFNFVTHISTGLSLICCLIMSISGYLSFTDKTEGNILNNFPSNDVVINIARLCFGLNMFTTSPLEAFVCREVIETLYFADKPFSYRRHVIITSVITFSTMLVSLTTCDLGIVLEVTGGLSATALAYLFPAMSYFKLASGPWYSRQRLPALLCALFGILVMFLSLLLSLRKIWSGEAGAGKKCD